MDDAIQKAYDIANYMQSLASQKHILKEEYNQNLIVYHNGGIFKADQTFISFVKVLADLSDSDHAVLVDVNQTPIDIANISLFLTTLVSTYTEASNRYYTKFSELKKSRSVESLMLV